MIKRILSLISVAVLLSSCGNTGKKQTSETESAGNTAKVEFASLLANPDDYVGKNIKVEGKVVHVCMETGKKLFIVGENPDVRLYIQAGETMPKFPMELMGSTVEVEGVITKPMAAAMPAEQGKMKVEGDTAMTPACETETALMGQTALADVVMEYKSHTVK